MKKLLVAASILLLVSQAAATTISSEQITVDLEDSTVNAEIHVEELTSSTLTLFTSNRIDNFQATVDGENIECNIFKSMDESRVECDVPRKDNFTIMYSYEASDLVETEQKVNTFYYSENFIRPTDNYSLKVILPSGAGILDSKNLSEPVISPPTDNIGSNGRRITVTWNNDPTIGETHSYKIMYENLSNQNNYAQIGLAAIAVLLIGAGGFFGFRYVMRENVENKYDDLSEDQIEIVEILRGNGGEMLQKDVVDSLDYSKAKVSGIVSDLVDEDIVVKEKEGRSNKLAISKKFKG